MKMQRILSSAVLALAGAVLAAPSAKAALTYNDGDLLLGFRASGSNYDYVINLGSASNFMVNGANSGYGTGLYVGVGKVTILSGTAFATDLSTAGLTSGTFGVFGGDNTNTDKTAGFATQVETTPGTASTALSNPSVSSMLTIYSNLSSFASQFKSGADTNNSPANQTLGTAPNSVTQHITADTNPNVAPNNYSSYFGSNNEFGFFPSPGEGTYSLGSNSQVIDLYEYDGGASGKGTLLGALQFQSNGTVVFDSKVSDFTPAPEPSALAALVTGIGVVGSFRFRRRNA